MTKSWSAAALLESTGSYWQACAIMAGVNLDLFNLLAVQKETSAGLAKRTETDERALAMLLRALAALELLEENGGIYHCSLSAMTFLVSDSPQYLGNIISHQHHLVESWAQLDKAVASGKPLRQRSSFSEQEWRKSFLLGMQNLANLIAPQLVPQIDIGQRTQMLDLGGGPGTWSIHFCQHNPNLHSTIFDLPGSKEIAEKEINDADMVNRIDFEAGDFNSSAFSARYDVIWMSHILHGEGEANCSALINKAAAALKDDGLLIIHEFILNDNDPGPVYSALFALNMLLGTDEGAAYSERQLRGMLTAAGLQKVKRLKLPPQSRSGIILAQKDPLAG